MKVEFKKLQVISAYRVSIFKENKEQSYLILTTLYESPCSNSPITGLEVYGERIDDLIIDRSVFEDIIKEYDDYIIKKALFFRP